MSGLSFKKANREAARKAKQQRKQQKRSERKQAAAGKAITEPLVVADSRSAGD